MRSLLLILFAFLSIGLSAQTVNDVPMDEINTPFIRIVGTQKLLSTKVMIDIEFGQHNKVFSAKDTQIRDAANKPVTFNSMIDAMNYMIGFGYRFEQAYVLTIGNQNVYHYLMSNPDHY